MAIEFDEFGPEKIFEVYDSKSGMHGFVVIDNTALGPGKGGIRMTKSVSSEEVYKLARTMTWKNSLAGLPFGGAKGGLIADPKTFDAKKKRAIMESFGRALRPVCPSQYVSAPDINTAEQEMEWFSKANGSRKACTGKPKKMGGIPHELGSTGFGVYHATVVAAQHYGLELKGARIAVEGFGNVGTFACQFLEKHGASIVATSDSKGMVYSEKGLRYAKLMEVKERTGSVTNYPGAQTMPGNEIISLPVDVLVTAAIPDLILADNASEVQAKIIVEGSNIPMTADVEEDFHNRGVLVVPDFVANAGGVISSFVEYTGGTPAKMFKLVEEKIKKNTKLVLEQAKKENVSPRKAGMDIAQERVIQAMKKRK